MKNNALFLDNVLRKFGEEKTPNSDVNLSQAIQNKAVLNKYRHLHSACSLYTLVN